MENKKDSLIQKLASDLRKATFNIKTIRGDIIYLNEGMIKINNDIVLHYNINTLPDDASKLTLLVFLFAEEHNKDFNFGTIYEKIIDPLGTLIGVAAGEKAIEEQEKNKHKKWAMNIYMDDCLASSNIDEIYSC